MYCSNIGCEARKLDGCEPVFRVQSDPFRLDAVPSVKLFGLGGNGGGGESGSAGEDGVAFSMRAQVK